MKPGSPLRTVLVLSLLTTLIGCSDLKRRLDLAAGERGRAEAGVQLAEWPTECRKKEPHAPLVAGEQTLSTLKRERKALDRANRRIDTCANYYDDYRRKLQTTE